ncbi:hypothetical protein ACFX1X_032249 [Malus domestica]
MNKDINVKLLRGTRGLVGVELGEATTRVVQIGGLGVVRGREWFCRRVGGAEHRARVLDRRCGEGAADKLKWCSRSGRSSRRPGE